MFYLFFPILLDLQKDGMNQIEEKKYKSDNFSEFSSLLIKQRKIDSIYVMYVRGQDSLNMSLFTFNRDGNILKKVDYSPNGEIVNNINTYHWENMFLKSQIQTTFYKDDIEKVDKYEYEYSFPKITTRSINGKKKVISIKVREYSSLDSTLINESNYSVEKGKMQIISTATYTYTDEGNIITKYYDDNKELGLTTISEKSQFVNSISVFDILPNGEIENMRILFYDKDGKLCKIMTSRNSTSSIITHIYKDGLLHEVSSSSGRYIYQYVFRKN